MVNFFLLAITTLKHSIQNSNYKGIFVIIIVAFFPVKNVL